MGEPEQWAVELWRKELASYYGPTCVIPERAALTIQRAFEERERKLREALRKIQDEGDARSNVVATQALKEIPDAE